MKAALSIASIALGLGSLPAAETAAPHPSERIDQLLADGWKKHDLAPEPLIDDATFLRRAYLTVIGRIPTVAEARRFSTWQAPDKRAKLIDQLLASEGYVHHFFNYWADVLRAKSRGIAGSSASEAYLGYIRDSLRENKPFDEFARELVGAEGECFDNPAVGYYMRDRGMPLDNLSNTTRIFLGTQMECAQCHDHPFDKWSQMDFYQMAAFTHSMTGGSYSSPAVSKASSEIRGNKELTQEQQDLMRRAITEATRPLRDSRVTARIRSLKLPHDYGYPDAEPESTVTPAVMFGESAPIAKEEHPIHSFTSWLTSPDNDRFTRVIANRLWKKVFGQALIEPLDALTDSSVASNPALMTYLEEQMVALDYDMKAFLSMLLKTRTFQRASTLDGVEPGMPFHFTGPVFRRMTAEQLWDSLVTLINPVPDEPNWTLREREQRDFENRARLSSLLEMTEPELILEAATEVAAHMTQQNKEFDRLRVELEEAREAKDSKRAAEIQRTLGSSNTILRKTVSQAFYNAASSSGSDEMKAILKEACADQDMDMAMMNMMSGARVNATEREFTGKEQRALEADAKLLGISEKNLPGYLKYRQSLHQRWCRAAELPSPAPRGHLLREFGQSDRDVIENASTEASVPQALTLMNSSLTTQLVHPYSAISMELKRAKTPAQKIEAIYLSLFSRKPTAEEADRLAPLLKDPQTQKAQLEDLVLAALTTQQFLFVE